MPISEKNTMFDALDLEMLSRIDTIPIQETCFVWSLSWSYVFSLNQDSQLHRTSLDFFVEREGEKRRKKRVRIATTTTTTTVIGQSSGLGRDFHCEWICPIGPWHVPNPHGCKFPNLDYNLVLLQKTLHKSSKIQWMGPVQIFRISALQLHLIASKPQRQKHQQSHPCFSKSSILRSHLDLGTKSWTLHGMYLLPTEVEVLHWKRRKIGKICSSPSVHQSN